MSDNLKNIKTYIVSIFVVALTIFLLNIAINFFTALSSPEFIKVNGSIDTWISFNGTVISSIIGGFVAGFIAFRITKIQLVQDQKNNYELRNFQIKQDLTFEINKKLLALNGEVLDNLQFANKHLHSIIIQANNYRDYFKSQKLLNEDIIGKMLEFIKNNFAEFDKHSINFFDTNMELTKTYSTYTVFLMDHKSKIEEIIENLILIGNFLEPAKKNCELIEYSISHKINITDVEYKSIRYSFNQFTDHCNQCYLRILRLTTDLQNSFEFLFHTKIEYPEIDETYFKRI